MQCLIKMRASVQNGVPLEVLRQFQTTMRGAFDDLFGPKRSWSVDRPGAHEVISLPPSTEGNFSIYAPPLVAHDILLVEAIDLIKAEKYRLRTCQNLKCQKRFVALKETRARFCSSQCSAYVRVNKSRGKM